MLYDVNVTRTSTATLTIRVVADGPDSARGMALELAPDQDFTGCVVEYGFDANDAVEVKDENSRRTVPTKPCRGAAMQPMRRRASIPKCCRNSQMVCRPMS